jgi:hypothetical protein
LSSVPLLVDLVKALAWPVAVSVIAWRVGPKFLDAIRGRAVNVEGFGVRASISTVEQQIASTDNPVNRPALEAAAPAPPAVVRETVQLIEREIRTELAKYALADREPALINALAATRVRGQHEFHYNRIFGSQIAGLKLLDERGSATVEEARAFFEPYAGLYPQVYATYGFDGWLAFMVNGGLVARTADRLTTTPFGHDFLVYLREVRLTEIKAG